MAPSKTANAAAKTTKWTTTNRAAAKAKAPVKASKANASKLLVSEALGPAPGASAWQRTEILALAVHEASRAFLYRARPMTLRYAIPLALGLVALYALAALGRRGAAAAPARPVRDAGPEAMHSPPRKWDVVDERADESFPASDPPGNY
jgi:hypothetical protein